MALRGRTAKESFPTATAWRHHTPSFVAIKRRCLTLAGLEAGVGFVDDVNPALAADHLVVAVTLDQRFERIADFHVFHPK